MADTSAASVRRAFYFLATLIMTTALLYAGREVLVPLALSVLLAFVLSVPQRALERRGMPRLLSVILVSLAALAVCAGLVWVVGGEFRNLANELPKYEDNIKAKLTPLRELLHTAENLEKAVPGAPPKATGTPSGQPDARQPVPVVVQPQSSLFLGWASSLAGPVLEFTAKAVLVVVLTVFVLARRENLIDRLFRLVGPHHVARTTKAIGEAAHRVSRYLLLLTVVNTGLGAAVALGLYLVGLPYALLWGVLSGALRYVPYIGIWLAAAFPLALSVAVAPGWTQPALVIGIYLGLELVTANVIEPLLFGHGTGVTPVALLVAAFFWAWLWGPLGLLLSTPLTVCLVVVGKHVPPLAFLDVLLEEAQALVPAVRFYQRLLAGDEVAAAEVLSAYVCSRPPLTVYDEVILPALTRVARDRAERQLTARDERAIFRLVHGLLLQLEKAPPGCAGAAALQPPDANGAAAPQRRVIACPARGIGDELAVEMLRQALRHDGVEVEVAASREALAGLPDAPSSATPPTICVVALAPGGLAACTNLCKRARARFRGAHLLAGRWGLAEDEDTDSAARRLSAVGVDDIGMSLLQTRTQVLAGLQLHRAQK